MRIPSGLCLIGFILFSSLPIAQSDESKNLLPDGFRCFLVVDRRFEPKDERNRSGKFHCPVCEFGLSPTLAIFSRSVPTNADDPLIKLIVLQDELSKKYKPLRMGAFDIFLTLKQKFEDDEDRDAKVGAISAFCQQTNSPHVITGLAEATIPDSEGNAKANPSLKSFGVEDNDEIVFLFYYRLKPVKIWKFTKDKMPKAEDREEITKVVNDKLEKLLR